MPPTPYLVLYTESTYTICSLQLYLAYQYDLNNINLPNYLVLINSTANIIINIIINILPLILFTSFTLKTYLAFTSLL